MKKLSRPIRAVNNPSYGKWMTIEKEIIKNIIIKTYENEDPGPS